MPQASYKLDYPKASTKPHSEGFTLLELLVGLVILIVLLMVTVVGIQGFRRSRALQNSGLTWETAIKRARAEAAVRGYCLQLVFPDQDDEESPTSIALRYQPDPLDAPDEWVDLDADWLATINDDALRIFSVKPLTAESSEEETDFQKATESTLTTIRFYPDGSCDSAEIVIAPQDETDTRRMIIRIVGQTGRVSSELLDQEELE